MSKYKSGLLFSLIFVVIIPIVYFMAGCGTVVKVKGEDNLIEYASMWNAGEAQAEYLRQMAAGFEKETGIGVKLIFSDRDVLTKIKSRLLMGDPPDLVEQEFNELSSLVTSGTLEPVDLKEMFYNEKGPEGQERLIDVFGEKFLGFYEEQGKLYLFPYEFVTSGFFYDKSLFSTYGLKAPESWEGFIRNNEILADNGINPIALDGNIIWYNAYYYCWAVERILGPEALVKAAKDPTGAVWEEPGYLKAAQMVYELGKAGKNHFQEGYEKCEWPTAQVEWAQGKHGSLLCSTWIPNETQNYAGADFEYGFYPFPRVEGGEGRVSDVEVGFIGCAIPKDSKKIGQAKAFLRFMTKEENARKFIAITNNISARTDLPYPQALADVREYLGNARRLYKPYGALWAEFPAWSSSVFVPLDNKLVYGKLTPGDFISQMKKESTLFWSQMEDKKQQTEEKTP